MVVQFVLDLSRRFMWQAHECVGLQLSMRHASGAFQSSFRGILAPEQLPLVISVPLTVEVSRKMDIALLAQTYIALDWAMNTLAWGWRLRHVEV